MAEQTEIQVPDRVRTWLDRMLDGTGDSCDSVVAAIGDPALAEVLSPAGRAVLDGWQDAASTGDGCDDC